MFRFDMFSGPYHGIIPIPQDRPPMEVFVEEFQDTIVPSTIPSNELIDWEGIESDIKNYEVQIEAILELEDVSESEFVEGLTDALKEADDTRKWIDFRFELFGERGNKYSVYEGARSSMMSSGP